MIGKTLGRFEILEDLGRGGMSSVYLVRDRTDGTRFALKVLPSSITRNPEYLKRFRREYEVMAALDHPNILRIRECDQDDGFHFYTMQYVPAPTLATVLERAREGGERLGRGLTFEAVHNLLQGLVYLHGKGLVHRDIKPPNIFLPPDGKAILGDFGLVKATDMTAITMTPSFIGTPDYASPEQILVEADVDARSDLYQAGLILFECLAGSLPFSKDLEDLISQKCLEPVPYPIRDFAPGVSAETEEFLLRAMAREPDDRFPSAAEMDATLISLPEAQLS